MGHKDNWKSAPVVVSCSAPVEFSEATSKLWSRMEDQTWHNINLQKSKSVMESLAWIVKKLSIPRGITEWQYIVSHNPKTNPRGFHSEKCSPRLPYVRWMSIFHCGNLWGLFLDCVKQCIAPC